MHTDQLLAMQKNLFIMLVLHLQVKIVVNNAAVMSHNWADKEFALARSTNYEGPVRLAEKLAPLMQTGRAKLEFQRAQPCVQPHGKYCPVPSSTPSSAFCVCPRCLQPLADRRAAVIPAVWVQ